VVEMVDDIDVEKTQNQLIENGVWLRPYGKLLYTMPPFNITDDELSTST
jgi:adenosylmethionine-8-amino-7-oxononanoate aminotransferase